MGNILTKDIDDDFKGYCTKLDEKRNLANSESFLSDKVTPVMNQLYKTGGPVKESFDYLEDNGKEILEGSLIPKFAEQFKKKGHNVYWNSMSYLNCHWITVYTFGINTWVTPKDELFE